MPFREIIRIISEPAKSISSAQGEEETCYECLSCSDRQYRSGDRDRQATYGIIKIPWVEWGRTETTTTRPGPQLQRRHPHQLRTLSSAPMPWQCQPNKSRQGVAFQPFSAPALTLRQPNRHFVKRI